MSETSATREPSHGQPSPTVRDLLAVLFRQARAGVTVFGLVLACVLAYGLLSPAYQAHMKILLRRGRVDPVITAEPNPPVQLARPAISEEEMNSEVELLREQGLLRKVVQQSGLASLENEKQLARASARLASRLKAEPIRKTNLIQVTYATSDPARGERVLSTLARLYLEKHKEVRRSSQELPFFEQQAEEFRQRLTEAEMRVLDFSHDRGVVSGALERDLSIQRAAEIEGNHRQVLVAIQETARRLQELRNKLPSLPERSTSQIRTADNPQLLETLKTKLLELELKRTALLTKYQPSYRLVQEVQEQIDQTKTALSAERVAPVREETTEKDPNYEWAKAELNKAEIELTALSARERGLSSELGTARKQAAWLGAEAIQQQDLIRGMKTAEESYLLYARKSEEARIADALDERGIVNAVLVEPPVAPVLPTRSIWSWLAIGFIAGAAAGVLAAFIVDYTDPAFRSPQEVVECLQAPVLASLPRKAA
jgi:polysaccharide biosynthesis protein PslE